MGSTDVLWIYRTKPPPGKRGGSFCPSVIRPRGTKTALKLMYWESKSKSLFRYTDLNEAAVAADASRVL
jgi:hypothetical protein